jgi:septal ring factor EnvC (AmiA/AmiB activator)
MIINRLISQALDDVRLEESLTTKELELDKLQIEIRGFELKVEEGKNKKTALEKKIKELKIELEVQREAADPKETPEEKYDISPSFFLIMKLHIYKYDI